MEAVTKMFRSDPRELAAVRALVRDACVHAWGSGNADAAIAQLELAVNEATANVMFHAYEGRVDRSVEVMIAVTPEQACVSLYHQGRAFDPDTVAAPAFDGSREGGFGLYLMRQTVDELRFFQDDAGRHGIYLVKNRR